MNRILWSLLFILPVSLQAQIEAIASVIINRADSVNRHVFIGISLENTSNRSVYLPGIFHTSYSRIKTEKIGKSKNGADSSIEQHIESFFFKDVDSLLKNSLGLGLTDSRKLYKIMEDSSKGVWHNTLSRYHMPLFFKPKQRYDFVIVQNITYYVGYDTARKIITHYEPLKGYYKIRFEYHVPFDDVIRNTYPIRWQGYDRVLSDVRSNEVYYLAL